MNQSDWFQLDDVEKQLELELLDSEYIESDMKANLQNNKTINNGIAEIEKQFQNLKCQPLNENVIKFSIIKIETNVPEKQINERSRLKMYCEERDLLGNIIHSQQNQQVQKVLMGSSIPMVKGLRTALLSMKEGESAWFKISGDQLSTSDNSENYECNIKINRYFKITVQEVSQPAPQLDPNNLEHRITQLEIFRKEGNALYNQGDYLGAITRYLRGINFISKWPKKFEQDISSELIKQQFSIVLTCNRAQGLMKLGSYKEAVDILIPLIEKIANQYPSKDNWELKIKSYYRLIDSLIQVNDISQAQHYLTEAKLLCEGKEELSLFIKLENNILSDCSN